MQQLFQSDFLLSTGRAILNSTWQMALLYLLFQLLTVVFRIQKASLKNFFASLLVLSGTVWFLVTVLFDAISTSSAVSVVIDNSANASLPGNFLINNQWILFGNWLDYQLKFILPYLSFTYLVFLGWFLLKFNLQLQAVYRLQTKGLINADKELHSFFELLVQSMGIGKKVQLFISTEIDTPSTIGFLKPLVLLPAAAVNHLTPAQLEAVLLHELAHIKRNDYFWNLLLTISETILFFNPFAQLLIAIARRERENSCDDRVMQYQQNAAVYAEALLNVEKARRLQPQLVMGLGDSKYHLMDRVKRILNMPAAKNKISSRIVALLLVTLIFTLTGWIVNKKVERKNVQEKELTKLRFPAQTFLLSGGTEQTKTGEQPATNQSQKLRFELKKEAGNDEYVLLNNKNGEKVKVDKFIIENLPAEWTEYYFEQSQGIEPEHQSHYELFESLRVTDSLKIKTGSNWKRIPTVEETEERKLRTRVTPRFFFNPELLSKLKPGWNFDSAFAVFEHSFQNNAAWNESLKPNHFDYNYEPEYFYHQKQSTDRERINQLKKRKELIQKIKQNDSLRRRINMKFAATEKRMIPEPVLEQIAHAEQLVANNKLIEVILTERLEAMNGKHFTIIISSDSLQNIAPVLPPRRIKHMEIIRL
jgi:beta-lactamase regulating signal transducer with metallopeptidase domain